MEAPSPMVITIIMLVLVGVLVVAITFCLIGVGLHKVVTEYGNTAIEGKVTVKGIYTKDGQKLSCFPAQTLIPSNTYVAYYLLSKQIGDIDFYNATPSTIVSIDLFDNTDRFVGAEISVPVQGNKEPDLSINLWKFVTTRDQKVPKSFVDAPWVKIANIKNVNSSTTIKSIVLTDNTVSVTSDKDTTIQTSKFNLNIPCSLTGVNTDLMAYDQDNTEIW